LGGLFAGLAFAERADPVLLFINPGLGKKPDLCFNWLSKKPLDVWSFLLSKFVATLLMCAFFMPGRAAIAADVTLYTESYGNFNYLDENGKVAGRAAGMMRQVMRESGLDFDIKLVPWNRAYRLATERDDALVYALMRRPDREPLFHWLVPVLETELYLYGRKDETRAINYALLKSGAIKGACTVGDVTCGMLRGFGIPDSQLIELTDPDHRAVTRVVTGGRADVFIAQDMLHGRRADAGPFPFKMLFELKEKQHFYLAAGKQVKPATVEAVRAAYARLNSSGKLLKLSEGQP